MSDGRLQHRAHASIRGLRLVLVSALLLALHAPTAQGEELGLRGKTLQRAIAMLEESFGLTIYYSSDAVAPWMSVLREPQAAAPEEMLTEIVAAHALSVEKGPRNSLLITRPSASSQRSTGDLLGIVKATGTGDRVSGADVTIVGSRRATTTSAGGHFSFRDLIPGSYIVRVNQSERALVTTHVADVEPGKTSVALIDVASPTVRELGKLVVSASRYQIDRDIVASHRFLPIDNVEKLPDLGDDPVRSVARLPGAANAEITAKSNIRGGEVDETLIRFDGMRLFNPFHLKDFKSVFSTIDPRIVSGMDVYTGGFPAAYGDRMSAVIDITTLPPATSRYNEVSLSFLNASVLSAGDLADGRGDWLVSARRGNLDLLLDTVDSDLGDPSYTDVFGRVGFQLTDDLRAAANVLYFGDDINVNDAEKEEQAQADYDDLYIWLRLDYQLTPMLAGHAIFSSATLSSQRSGFTEKEGVSQGWVEDDRDFTIDSLLADFSWRLSDSLRLNFGGDLRRQDGKYDYQDEVTFDLVFLTPGANPEPERQNDIRIRPDGYTYGLYGRAQLAVTDRLAADFGLRWDRQSLGSRADAQLSPRLGLMYTLGESTELRASWGRFYQSQSVNELQVEDGVTEFFDAQRSDHTVLSLAQRLPANMSLRVEAYWKEMDDLRPRYENLLNPLVLLPELTPDRIEIAPKDAKARGIEAALWHASGGALDWWLSYTWASVKDRFADKNIRRSWDQVHAVGAGVIWTPGNWELSLAGTFHTGWPTTTAELLTDEPIAIAVTGPRNGTRLDDYSIVDMRVAREFPLRRSSATVFAEITNLFDWTNECCTEYDVDDEEGPLMLDTETLKLLPRFVSLGFVWRF